MVETANLINIMQYFTGVGAEADERVSWLTTPNPMAEVVGSETNSEPGSSAPGCNRPVIGGSKQGNIRELSSPPRLSELIDGKYGMCGKYIKEMNEVNPVHFLPGLQISINNSFYDETCYYFSVGRLVGGKRGGKGKKKNGGVKTVIREVVVKQAPKKKKSKKQKKKGGLKGGGPNRAYAAMLNDPCNCTMVKGFYGSSEGNLGRMSILVSPDTGYATSTYFVLLWNPDFYNPRTTAGPIYCSSFQFGASLATAFPASTGYGAGSAADTTTAHSIDAPGYAFVNGDTAQDARTISACIKTVYTGTTSGCKGMLYPLTNVPSEAIIFGGAGGAAPTFNDWMRYAGDGRRADEGIEVKYRPNLASVKFKNAGPGPILVQSGVAPQVGNNGDETKFIGVLFANVTSASDFVNNYIQVIEWKAEPGSFFSHTTPKGMDDTSIVRSAVNTLDSMYPGWQSRAASTATNLLTSAVAKMALGGAGMSFRGARGGLITEM